MDDVKKGYNAARNSAIAHNNALKQQTLGAKAATVAMKALSIAGNMIAMWAITKVVELAVKKFDELAHSAEHCKERVDELMSSYKSAIDTANSNAKKVEELADKYESLSKGVNDLGENVSLTTDEYKEYNSIVNEIADMFPTLVKGYTDEGNAILNLKGNVEQLRDAYREAQQEAYNMLIVSGKDSDGNDIITNYQNQVNSNEPWWTQTSSYFDGEGGAKDAIDIITKLTGALTPDEFRETYNQLYEEYENIWYSDKIQNALKSSGFEALSHAPKWSEITADDLANVRHSARATVQTLNAEIELALKDVETLANAYLMTNEDYVKLDEQSKNAASIIVNSLNTNIASGFASKEDVGAYVDKIVQTILTNTDVKNAMIGLFTMNTTDMPIDDVANLVNQYIRTISSILEEDSHELKIRLGFDDIDALEDNYLTMLNDVAKRVSGIEIFDPRYVTEEQSLKYNEIYHKIDEFAKQYSINTQDEIAAFRKALDEANYDIEKAFEDYLATEVTEEAPKFFTQLNNSKDSLDKFQSSVKSAYDAYATLLSGNYSSNELLDSIQAINQAMSDIGSEIQWESMLGGGIGLAQVQEVLEREFQKYAESIGIDDTVFSNMLANIINTQKASAQLEELNDQIDSLQSAYSDLTDIVDTYNETGYITFDQLQKLLEMEPQYLSCLIDENGQLQLNEQSMAALAEQRLIDARAQAVNQAIVELGELAYKDERVALEESTEAFRDEIDILADYNESLAAAIAETSVMTTEISNLNAAIRGAEANGASDDQINAVLDNLETKWKLIDKVMDQAKNGGIGSVMKSSSSKSSSSKDFEETFDWIETAIDRIERSISNLDLKASSVYRSWSERNSNLKAELLDVKKEMDIQASGYNRYMQQANSVGLSEEWANKVRNGQIDINSITDKALAEQIKSYTEYYEKAIACQDAVESLRESVSKLYETAFDNIVSQFDSIVSVIENSKSMLDEQINQSEERGYIANVAYYEALIKVEQKNIEQLTKERTSLQSALADAISNGAIAEGSAEWADMQQKINDVTLSIEQANTAMIKYGNSIRDIQWQIFDLIQDRISRISSESDFLINLLSYDKQYDDRGQLTDTGMSTVGLHGMNYNVYMAQADKYAQEMLRINEELAKDPNNLELYNRKAELIELQQESIIAAENEKQAIIDMVEEGINLELDALKELIDTYTDVLDAQKDLYDYQKNIAKQTEEIASLQKQLSAYEGDLSEEARQKVQQIKVSLENAQKDLQQTEMDKYFENSKKSLNDLYQEYELALNQRLDNIDALIADMIASSNANAGMISDTLSSKADSVGYYLSESMEDIWNTNTGSMLDALAMYDSNIMGGFAEVNTSVGEVIRGVTETVSGIGNVNTTINNAINSVTGNMQAILDKLSAISTMQSYSAASSYYGGSGGTGTSSSGSSGSGSSGSGLSGSGGSGGSGFFIYKKDNYAKGSLNIQTSIIDRLKYHDFDSSFSARSSYYNKMGFSGTYTGTDSQNIQMLNWMKLNGYKNGVYNLKRDELAWTQEGGKAEVILNPDGSITRPDGSVLTPLKQGDSVLNADATKNLYSFMNNPQAFVRSMGLSNIPVPQNTRQNTISNDIQLTIELPNVQNYEQFKYALQHDKQFEKVVQAMTTERAAGGSSLKKYNI